MQHRMAIISRCKYFRWFVSACIFAWIQLPRIFVGDPSWSQRKIGGSDCRAYVQDKLGPASMSSLEKLEVLREDTRIQRVVVIFRHGHKEIVEKNAFLPDEIFWRLQQEASLTEVGRRQAQELGKRLQTRGLDAANVEWVELLSSEAPRCIDTMLAVQEASNPGHPGHSVKTVKTEAAWMNATHRPREEKEAADEMRAIGWQSIMERLSSGERITGYLSLDEAVQKLRNTSLTVKRRPNDPNVGASLKPLEMILVCTHDVILYALATWFMEGMAPNKPDFLETALWWQEGGQEHFYYGSQEFVKKCPSS